MKKKFAQNHQKVPFRCPWPIYDRGPAKTNLRVNRKIFRTADLVKVVISAMADFSSQGLILFSDKVRRDFFFSKRKRRYPTCQL